MAEAIGVWSHRAEQLVSELIAALRPEQLDPLRTHAARLSALPIGVDIWSDYYLRSDGQVVIVGEDLDNPDVGSVYSDRLRVLSVLVWGSERYPELRELLPERQTSAIDCMCLQRPDLFEPGKLICSICGGVGWLPAGIGESDIAPECGDR